MVTISVLTEASDTALAELNNLMRMLREGQSDIQLATLDELKQILSDVNASVVVAKDGDHIVGVASIFVLQKIGKRIATVEDVVVDEAYRGQGLGQKLMEEIIAVARAKRVRSIGLTSRPARVAGNKLYQKMGFVLKETNVYRLTL